MESVAIRELSLSRSCNFAKKLKRFFRLTVSTKIEKIETKIGGSVVSSNLSVVGGRDNKISISSAPYIPFFIFLAKSNYFF